MRTDRSPKRSAPSAKSRYITIPPHKSLRATAEPGGAIMRVWDSTDDDIPADVLKGEPFDYRFVEDWLIPGPLNDAAWGKDVDGIYMAVQLRGAFQGAVPGEVVKLEEKEWEALCERVRKPSRGYSTPMMIVLVDWLDLILDDPPTSPPAVVDGVHDEARIS